MVNSINYKEINTAFITKSVKMLKKHYNDLLDPNDYLRDDKGNETSWTPLLTCCYTEFMEGVDFLLSKNANPNKKGKDGMFPLLAAAIKEKTSILLTLLKNGAQVNQIDAKGKTALMLACEVGNTENVIILLNYNAKIDLKCNHNKTCYDYAMQSNNFEIKSIIQKFLLESNVKTKDTENKRTKI